MTSLHPTRRPIITIVGSYNEDLTFVGNRFPQPGETVMADQLVRGSGGKGSNQAIAARRFGADTRLGDDTAGKEALALYRRLGISTDNIWIDPFNSTGAAVILVNRGGENMISIAPGANMKLNREDIDAALPCLQESSIIGFQLENDLEVVSYGLRTVHEMGGMTFLDPAPAQPLPEDLYPYISILKPNNGESSLLSGLPVESVEQAMVAGEWFRARGVGTVIITLGKLGTVLVTADTSQYFPSPDVTPVDSTGAGDIFSGAFLASFAGGKPIPAAIRFANAAAALSTERYGVVDSIPTMESVLALLERQTTPIIDYSIKD
jgi:ribokinase